MNGSPQSTLSNCTRFCLTYSASLSTSMSWSGLWCPTPSPPSVPSGHVSWSCPLCWPTLSPCQPIPCWQSSTWPRQSGTARQTMRRLTSLSRVSWWFSGCWWQVSQSSSHLSFQGILIIWKKLQYRFSFSVSENSCNVILLSHLIYIPGIILLCLFFLLFLGLIVLVIIQLASANSIQEMPSQEWNLDNLDEMTTKIRKRNWRGLGLRSIWPSRRSPVVEPQSKCSVCSNLLSPIEESCSKCQEQYNRLSQVLPGSVLSGDSFDLICRRNVSYYISSHAYYLF